MTRQHNPQQPNKQQQQAAEEHERVAMQARSDDMLLEITRDLMAKAGETQDPRIVELANAAIDMIRQTPNALELLIMKSAPPANPQMQPQFLQGRGYVT